MKRQVTYNNEYTQEFQKIHGKWNWKMPVLEQTYFEIYAVFSQYVLSMNILKTPHIINKITVLLQLIPPFHSLNLTESLQSIHSRNADKKQ